MILAGDIGGTKSHFGIFDANRLVFERRLANADFSSFEAVFKELVATPGFRNFRLRQVRLAVAGPVEDDGRSAQMINLPWHIDASRLESACDVPQIRLANDFAAAALGAITSDGQDLVTLQAGQQLDTAPRLVVGAGTGLGMAIVVPQGTGWHVIPGEGGHVGFAPTDDEQIKLWRFMRQRHARVTWERLVAGPGLAAIHACLSGADAGAGGDLDPGEISQRALAAPESVAGAALRLFVSLFGAYAGDMALAVLPRGGVYLAGGIAAKILPVMRTDFIPAFNAKPPHAALAARMPVHVATDPYLALRGAALL